MTRLDQPINRDDHEPAQSWDPIPAGWYAVAINDAEIKESSSGHNMLRLKLEVDPGMHPDTGARILFSHLNIWHPDLKTSEIANRTLTTILHVCGIVTLTDTDQLLGKRLAARVTIRPAKDGFDAGNDVKGYDSIEARFQGVPVTPAPRNAKPAAKPAAGTNAAAPPWAKRQSPTAEDDEVPF